MKNVYHIVFCRYVAKNRAIKNRVYYDLIFEDRDSAENYLLKEGWSFYKKWTVPFDKRISYKNVYINEEFPWWAYCEIEELKVFQNEENDTMQEVR